MSLNDFDDVEKRWRNRPLFAPRRRIGHTLVRLVILGFLLAILAGLLLPGQLMATFFTTLMD